jgi:glycosyltransferase involved in cell wall biosynthesis
MLGIKIVWTVHNLVDHSKKFSELELFFSRKIAYFSDKIIAHCNSAKRDIRRIYCVKERDKIVVIPPGSFLNSFKNTVSRVNARSRLNLPQKDLTFLFLGLIRPYKGIVELVDCFQDLNCSNTKLVIAGRILDQQHAEYIRKKVKGNSNILLMFGYIPDDEMQIYMNAADIVVCPYRDILSPGSVISGMTFEKAIITPQMGCIPEMLNSSGGFLYDPQDRRGLLNAMRRATNVSPAMIQDMGRHNFNLAKQMEWRDVAASTYKVYEGCFRRT